jgi:hypothetical protein
MKIKYAPRLKSNDIRLRNSYQFPDEIHIALKEIAKIEKKSVSWVLEEVVIDYFGLNRPKYKNGKR